MGYKYYTGTETVAKIEDQFWRDERKEPIMDKIFENYENEKKVKKFSKIRKI